MSRTIEIPGGAAELFTQEELTPRRQKPVKSLFFRSGALLDKLANNSKVIHPDGSVEEDPNLPAGVVQLSQADADLLVDIQYATTWAYLKSWTLDLPLPKSPDELLDIPSHIVDVLNREAKAIDGGVPIAAAFEPSEVTLEDEDSPTGASGDSATPSPAAAPEA
jgi:hypothetical protein